MRCRETCEAHAPCKATMQHCIRMQKPALGCRSECSNGQPRRAREPWRLQGYRARAAAGRQRGRRVTGVATEAALRAEGGIVALGGGGVASERSQVAEAWRAAEKLNNKFNDDALWLFSPEYKIMFWWTKSAGLNADAHGAIMAGKCLQHWNAGAQRGPPLAPTANLVDIPKSVEITENQAPSIRNQTKKSHTPCVGRLQRVVVTVCHCKSVVYIFEFYYVFRYLFSRYIVTFR